MSAPAEQTSTASTPHGTEDTPRENPPGTAATALAGGGAGPAAIRRRFTKGHGTENDFVLIPDLDGSADLDAAAVRRIADRRAGIGADGVIRVVRARCSAEPSVAAQAGQAEWFMDYRNADGSLAEMCGNGTRVFAAYLRRAGLVTGDSYDIATRAGIRRITVTGDEYATGMGRYTLIAPGEFARQGSDSVVTVPGMPGLPALSVGMGNPHAVVALPAGADLDALDLGPAPRVHPEPPDGTNVEFVQILGGGHLRMRVFERGVGETRSCGTGAAAAAVAAMLWSGDPAAHTRWQVDVPGGTLHVTVDDGGQVTLAGPAVLVADGETIL